MHVASERTRGDAAVFALLLRSCCETAMKSAANGKPRCPTCRAGFHRRQVRTDERFMAIVRGFQGVRGGGGRGGGGGPRVAEAETAEAEPGRRRGAEEDERVESARDSRGNGARKGGVFERAGERTGDVGGSRWEETGGERRRRQASRGLKETKDGRGRGSGTESRGDERPGRDR